MNIEEPLGRDADAEEEEWETVTLEVPHESEVARREAEAEERRAHARLFEVQAEAASAKARWEEAEHLINKQGLDYALDLQRMSWQEASWDHNAKSVADRYHRVFAFTEAVSSTSVKAAMKQITEWSRLEPGCDIEVIFNSPGGDVIFGMAFYDFLKGLSRAGHSVTTVTLGYAASMAGILLQAGDRRVMGAESYLLIHEITAGSMGKIGEMEDDVKFYAKICSRIVKIFVDRSGGKITAGQFRKNWERKDWWLSSDEALRYGFVDEVR